MQEINKVICWGPLVEVIGDSLLGSEQGGFDMTKFKMKLRSCILSSFW